MVLGKNKKINQRESPSGEAAIRSNPQGHREGTTPTGTKIGVPPITTCKNRARTLFSRLIMHVPFAGTLYPSLSPTFQFKNDTRQ